MSKAYKAGKTEGGTKEAAGFWIWKQGYRWSMAAGEDGSVYYYGYGGSYEKSLDQHGSRWNVNRFFVRLRTG